MALGAHDYLTGETRREEAVVPHGEVRVDISKCVGVSHASRVGDLNIGMMGVTVNHPDGTSTMFPWRVICWVQMDGVRP